MNRNLISSLWKLAACSTLLACSGRHPQPATDPSRSIPVIADSGGAVSDASVRVDASEPGQASTGSGDGARDAGMPPSAAAMDAAVTHAPSMDAAALDAASTPSGDAMLPIVATMPPAPAGSLDEDGGADEDAGPTFRPPRLRCTGKLGAPGTTTRMYKDRSYVVHIPKALDPNAGVPVLFSFHGSGGNGADMETGTGFDVLADQLGFVTVYPNGAAGSAPWNVGRNVCPPGNFVSTYNDDMAYFDAMLDGIEADQCIDRERVFAMGLSMGGYFTHNLGCKLAHGRLRAFAAHSSGTYAGNDCPGAPVPVLIVHGDSDSLINYQCGVSARDYWVTRNGCSSDVDTLPITGGHCDFNRNCPKDGQVALCTYNGLDHAYAYPPMYTFSSLLIWEFFDPYW